MDQFGSRVISNCMICTATNSDWVGGPQYHSVDAVTARTNRFVIAHIVKLVFNRRLLHVNFHRKVNPATSHHSKKNLTPERYLVQHRNSNKISYLSPKMNFDKVTIITFHRTQAPNFEFCSDLQLLPGGIYPFGNGSYTLLVFFALKGYPLHQHCRYVRHRDSSLPYTFSNMEFVKEPPGLRIGPWPGWHDIPPMPKIKLRIGDREYDGRFDFWGDEESQQHVRGVFECEIIDENNIFLNVEDNRLIPVTSHVYPSIKKNVQPIPISLRSELINQHPRLLFGKNEVDAFRRKVQSSHQHLWNKIYQLLNNWDVQPIKTAESKIPDNVERLFPEDRVIISAFLALIETTDENKNRAVHALINFVEMTKQDGFEPLKIDTQSGEMLFILCIGYDWCNEFLKIEEKEKVKKRLFEVADLCWDFLGYARHDYAQAHFLGCAMGLLAFSFLFWKEHPRAQEWASYFRGVLEQIIRMLPEDGFYPHGINLWIYEHGFLLRWLELFRYCAGEDSWTKTSYWKNASRFRLAATSPDGLYGTTIGDPQYRVCGDSWCHYLIASRTHSEEAQWLGDLLSDTPIEGVDYRSVSARRRVYEFLFYNEKIKSVESSESLYHFKNGGQIFIRNTDESNSSLFTFRSDSPLGKQRYDTGERGGYGHSDPANGSFLLYSNNDFVVCGPGPTYRRDTSLHNTITIDGQGQIGDSTVWVPDFFPLENIPPIPEIKSFDDSYSLRADITRSYLPHLGVKKCVRSMFVDLKKYLVGVDEIVLESKRNIEWNIHSWGEIVCKDNRSVLFTPPSADHRSKFDYRLFMLSPKNIEWQTGITEMIPAYPHDGKRDYYLRVSKNANEVMFVWCLVLQSQSEPAMEIINENKFRVNVTNESYLEFYDGWLLPHDKI